MHDYAGHFQSSGSPFYVEGNVLICGAPQTGKSTELVQLASQHFADGFCLIDPYGAASRMLLDQIPYDYIGRTIYISPSEFPTAWNVLKRYPPERVDKAIAAVLEPMQGIWGDSWGPRMADALRCSIAALNEYEPSYLLEVTTLLTDKSFRDMVLLKSTNETVLKYFKRFEGLPIKEQLITTDPVINKLDALGVSPIIRRMIDADGFNIDKAVQEKQIIIANFGDIGAENAALLSSFLFAQLPQYRVYVDGLDEIATPLIKPAFKRGTTLTATGLKRDGFGTIMSFRVGLEEADGLAKEYGGGPNQFIDLNPYRMRVKIPGMGNFEAYSTQLPERTGYAEAVRTRGTERFTPKVSRTFQQSSSNLSRKGAQAARTPRKKPPKTD